MREIVTLQIGGAGNAIGDAFWHVISHEHGVDYNSGRFVGTSPLQLERLNVFFNATVSRRFYVRSIVIDTEASTIQRLHTSSQLYRPENFVAGTESAGNNFARGYHTDGAEILQQVLENTRREVEAVDSLQGFQLLHSIGGGTGSGLTSLIMESLVEQYSDNLLCNYVTIPSPNMSQVVVEPYNALLSTPALVNNSHLTFCLDNEALFHICNRNLKIKMCGYEHINHIVALTMSGITTCLRFPGQLNAGLRKIYVNMVPFPRLHFLIPGFAPLVTCTQQQFSKGTVSELVQQIFSSNNLLCAIDLRQGKLLTAAGIFRGRMSPREVDQMMTGVRNKNLNNFVDWIPNNIKTAICDIPPRGLKMSATFIGNTTAIQTLFQRLLDGSSVMLRRKAHLHWYTGEGMEEQEFIDAQQELQAIIDDYRSSAEMDGDGGGGGGGGNGNGSHDGSARPSGAAAGGTKCPHCGE
ncbi:probable tubulin beta chain CG32396 [Drosophila guanche]|uniref:Tubulin beta chain n=1 Tax=Drosophila guanche TaxID=7266 RepID=A0A3B0JXT1_DROGU|nr:probable tubulin beta chain CG32396 [Drosophila guanche]SPP86877.1 blast:Probable tubulin beta chain CG32396 [Drosophila guanche]